MSIVRRGKRGIWTADFYHDDKHRRQSLKTNQLRIARQRAAQLDRQLSDGKFATSHSRLPQTKVESMTIEFAIKKYLEYCKTQGNR
ncbi:MAG: hypothetical protein J0M17_10815, partial [Planctomycetes bacterium]|nr:hypothetical protein [Planctomycetota bacterium]